jgi:hypothetical protein
MKKYLFALIICVNLVACGGGSSPTFAGVWSGSYSTTNVQNDCPFSVATDVNPLFPMTVSVDANDVFTVVAVDGSVAIGGQGQGEDISFLAQSSKFGNYGSIAPYTCESVVSGVGYLAIGDDQAKVTLTVTFTNCTSPSTTDDPVTCAAIYFGDAQRIG